MIIWIVEIVKTNYQMMIDGVIEITFFSKLKIKSYGKKFEDFDY